MTRTTISVLRLVALCFALTALTASSPLRPEMNVRQGPEKVFKLPVSEVVPALRGARATGRNGRVGNEFVFWGYRLADGTPAYLYACAPAAGVDCLARRELICNRGLTVISENSSSGAVQRLTCVPICKPSESATPCCTGGVEQLALEIGVVSCN